MSAMALSLNDDDRERIANATALCGVLRELLDEEYALMQSRDSERLAALLERKQRVVQDLGELEPRLRSWLADPLVNTQAPLATLRSVMLDCRQLNQRNRDAAATGARLAKRSIETLRRAMHMDDLDLYGEDGALRALREKRRLGSH